MLSFSVKGRIGRGVSGLIFHLNAGRKHWMCYKGELHASALTNAERPPVALAESGSLPEIVPILAQSPALN
jgi:hypothetical protein